MRNTRSEHLWSEIRPNSGPGADVLTGPFSADFGAEVLDEMGEVRDGKKATHPLLRAAVMGIVLLLASFAP
jgi:hypothetical protein